MVISTRFKRWVVERQYDMTKKNSIIFVAILFSFAIYTYVIHVPKIDMQNYCEIIFMNLELFHVSISEEEGSVNFK